MTDEKDSKGKPGTALQKGNPAAAAIQALVEKQKAGIAEMIAASVKVDQYIRLAMMALAKDETLAKCTPESIVNSIIVCGQLTLEPNSPLQHAAIVPFWNGKRNCFEAQVVPQYQGLIYLARKSGKVLDVEARPVFAKDVFRMRFGTEQTIEHEPCLKADRGKVIGYYCITTYRDGTRQHVEWMPADEVEKIKKFALTKKRRNDGPWIDWEVEQGRKTIVRRASKYWPKTREIAVGMQLVAQDEQREPIDYGAIIDLGKDDVHEITDPTPGPAAGGVKVLPPAAEGATAPAAAPSRPATATEPPSPGDLKVRDDAMAKIAEILKGYPPEVAAKAYRAAGYNLRLPMESHPTDVLLRTLAELRRHKNGTGE